MVNIEADGVRPRFTSDPPALTDLSYCPGYRVDDVQAGVTPATHEYGFVLRQWEGHAGDGEIRTRASSGGVLSALAAYCLGREGMKAVVHTAMDEAKPWLNKTVISRTRAEILDRTGSRYAPSSPCEALGYIEESDGPCVFIGKPCDAAAVAALRRRRPRLDRNLGLVLTFFCAGTPSTRGTLDLLESLGTAVQGIQSIRYRGEGWPGFFRVRFDDNREERTLGYEQSWGKLARYKPLRCNLCADGLGHLGDVSCGDAWNRYTGNGDPGQSIILARNATGQTIVERAAKSGFLVLQPTREAEVLKAQVNLLDRRRHLHGRFLAMRIFSIPHPEYCGFSLRDAWKRLPLGSRLRSVFGTGRRILQRRLFVRQRQAGSAVRNG